MRFSLKKSVFSEPNHLLVNWKSNLFFPWRCVLCITDFCKRPSAWTPLSSSFTYPPPTPRRLNELMAPCSFWKIQILEDFGDSLGIPRDSKGFLRINFVESNHGDVCEVSSPWSNIVPTCWMCFKRKVTTESQTFPSDSLRGQYDVQFQSKIG